MSQRLSVGSQQSQAKAKSQTENISSREMQQITSDVVRYFLMHDFDKHPIKHSELLKNCFKSQSRSSGQIIEQAQKHLMQIYGLELILLDQKVNKQYILVNAVDVQDHISFPGEVESNLVLLAVILSFIFMVSGSNEAGVDQAKVHEFLASLDIDVDETHDYFGDIKKTLKMFEAQNYLNLVKIERTDPVKYEYKWGERAVHELPLRRALEFASEMCGVDNLERWTAHYKVVLESEGNS